MSALSQLARRRPARAICKSICTPQFRCRCPMSRLTTGIAWATYVPVVQMSVPFSYVNTIDWRESSGQGSQRAVNKRTQSNWFDSRAHARGHEVPR